MNRIRYTQKIELRPVLAARLIDSLNILILPRSSLLDLVEMEAEDNPFIEIERQRAEVTRQIDLDYIREESRQWSDIGFRGIGKGTGEYTEPPDTKKTLQKYLLEEVGLICRDNIHLEIAKELIYSLDENGWLRDSPDEVAGRMGVERETVLKVIEMLKGLEPAGIAVSDLRESLLTQLERGREEDTLAFRILKDAYDCFLLLNKHRLANKFAVSEEDIENALERIYKLDPYPGRRFSGEPQYISPDAVIEQTEDGYIVYIPEWDIPRISIRRELLEDTNRLSDREKDYLIERLNRAKNFIQAIEQRKETIRKIAEFIKNRESIFLTGDGHPELITEREVAQYVGVHVSTISRAIKDKWVETPRGMFRFSYFFSQGRKEEYHPILSALQEMVEREDKSSPLSDISIACCLRKRGFNIARTTVVKYRGILGILSSSKRRMKAKTGKRRYPFQRK